MDLSRVQRVTDLISAESFIKDVIRARRSGDFDCGQHFGYDVYLKTFLDFGFHKPLGEYPKANPDKDRIGVLLMDAAADLVLRGILRPGPRIPTGQQCDDAYGNGFSLTERGKDWLAAPI